MYVCMYTYIHVYIYTYIAIVHNMDYVLTTYIITSPNPLPQVLHVPNRQRLSVATGRVDIHHSGRGDQQPHLHPAADQLSATLFLDLLLEFYYNYMASRGALTITSVRSDNNILYIYDNTL